MVLLLVESDLDSRNTTVPKESSRRERGWLVMLHGNVYSVIIIILIEWHLMKIGGQKT